MDTSTAGVTLNTGFVFDVLREYEDSRKLLGPLFAYAKGSQTFNCMMQDGLLMRLLELTGVTLPSVNHARCTRRGDAFCEYELRWLRGAG